MLARARTVRATPPMALDRLSVSVNVTTGEYEDLARQATAAGLSVPQYVRTRCEFPVRWSSVPGTEARENEADEAWEQLKHNGIVSGQKSFRVPPSEQGRNLLRNLFAAGKRRQEHYSPVWRIERAILKPLLLQL